MTDINLKKTSTHLVLGCRVAITLIGGYWLLTGATLQFTVAAVALLLTSLPDLTVRDVPLRIAMSAVTAFLLAAHIVLGMHLAFYETSAYYDKIMHVIGSGAIAGLLMLAVHRYCQLKAITLPTLLSHLLVLCGTLSAGTLWELFEFAIDRTGLFNAQRGLSDTMIDLLADAGGAIAVVTLLLLVDYTSSNRRTQLSLTPGKV